MSYHVHQRYAFPFFFSHVQFQQKRSRRLLGYMVENEVIKSRWVVALDTAVVGGLWGVRVYYD